MRKRHCPGRKAPSPAAVSMLRTTRKGNAKKKTKFPPLHLLLFSLPKRHFSLPNFPLSKTFFHENERNTPFVHPFFTEWG